VDLLVARGFRVNIIDNFAGGHEANIAHHKDDSGVKLFHGDIRELNKNYAAFDRAQYVFHFAGIGDIVPSIENPAYYMDVNVQGTVRMLECARHAGVKKFVYAASSSCYGLADTPTGEDHPINPQYPYALSKYLGEQAAFHWSKVYKLPVNSVCIFNAYGPRVRTTGAYGAVFGVFLKQKLAGKPFTVVGDGTQRRDFIYVTDVAKAFLAVAELETTGERYNIGAGNPRPVNELIALIGGPSIFMPKRPGEPECTWADIGKITRATAWRPEVSFADGVKEMLARIDDWEKAPLWDEESINRATKSWFDALSS
ncbi:MAG: NAD-dependent epimerase/dehydratase family protein, partial [Bdellovibrionales bacterium]